MDKSTPCLFVLPSISHNLKRVVTFSFIFFLSLSLFTQSLRFKQYKTDEGLPHNVGYDIHQDKEGFIWIAMDNGLTRFDGLSFKNYTVDDGLNGPYVITLSEDQSGDIWAGVHLKGINRISKDNIYRVPMPITMGDPKIVHHKSGDWLVNENTPLPTRHSNIIGIHKRDTPRDSINWIYFHIVEGKILSQVLTIDHRDIESRYKKNKKTTNYHPANLNLKQLSDGRIFMLSEKGVLIYDPQSMSPFLPAPLLPKENFLDMDEDLEGNTWFLAKDKLYFQQAGKSTQTYTLPLPLHSGIKLKVIDQEKIFILSNNREQLFRLNIKTGAYEDLSPNFKLGSIISFIEKDREKNLWFTTMGDGVFSCHYNYEFKNFSTQQGLINSYVNSIVEDKHGDILVCTWKGMSKIKGNKVEEVDWVRNSRFHKKEVFDVYPKKDGSYILSLTGLGTHVISADGSQDSLISRGGPKKLSIYDDSLIFVGYDYQKKERLLDFWDLASMRKRAHKIDRMPNSIMSTTVIFPNIDHKGYWANHELGLILITKNVCTPYPLPHGLSQVKFNDIYKDKDQKKNIWFAGEKGILKYDGSRMVYVNKEKNWPLFPCRQLLFDKHDNLWMASPDGLYLWDQKQLTRFSTQDGMISNDIRSLLIDSKNKLWIGTSFGVSSIDLDKLPLKTPPPELRLSKIYLDNQESCKESILSISKKQQLKVEYYALSFVSPEKLEYAYQLRPDADWQNTHNTFLDLRGLQTGSYQLKIKARKFNSDWSKPVDIPFEIFPPWWKRIWAYFLFGTLILGAILSITYLWGNYVKKKAQAQNQIAYEMAQLKLQVLQSQLNPHFIFNALNVIQGYILENDIIASNLYLERFSHLMRRFLESSKKNQILLSDEIELLNLFVEMEQLCYEERFTYAMNIDKELSLDSTLIPSMLIQPFVENAIHHGLLKKVGKGHLSIKFKKRDTHVLCSIIDDGIGREASKIIREESGLNHISRGMQIVSERLKTINYLERQDISIQIIDIKDTNHEIRGTRVEILWPIKEAYNFS